MTGARTLLAVAMAGLALGCGGDDVRGDFAVVWSESLQVASVDDVRARMSDPIDGGGATLHLTDGDRIARPENVYEWLVLRGVGYEPVSNADIKIESHFRNLAAPLVALRLAQPSTESRLRGLDLREDALSVLPAELGPILSGDERDRVAALSAGSRSYADAWPEARVTNAEERTVHVEHGGDLVFVDLQVLGDFDGDGVEDALAAVSHVVTKGTYASYRHALLSWTTDDEELRILRWIDEPWAPEAFPR